VTTAVDLRGDEVLSWHEVEVDGRRAVYGVGGPPGAPVLFLHGWALGSRAYKRPMRRLTRRGCRVYAPALPAFGGTADLPAHQNDIGGYASWVVGFMDAVGIDEPAMVVGHSFGGGVAIELAHAAPERVGYLVLLNAIGGVARRGPWSWAAGFARELWPPGRAIETADAMRADLVPNFVRNPLGLARVGLLARDANLRDELADLRARGVPVLALTSDDDGVIPRSGFDAVCDAVGTAGRVVSGRHCWLLADPDAFDSVLAAVVDLRVGQHRDSHAAASAGAIVTMLNGVMPGRTVRSLVAEAAPLWLLSDNAAALAGDLALCHPKLGRGEVRAVARPIEASALVRLTVVTADRPGLLADSASVLTANELSIRDASAATWPARRLAVHSFTVADRASRDDAGWEQLGSDLRAMVRDGVTPVPFRSRGPVDVTVDGSGMDRSLVRVRARDQIGLLAAICRWFAMHGLNVESVHARTVNRIASDDFIVSGPCDGEGLRKHLDGDS
jgi:pimeloyl-ACP methyl ester carboxylesterase/glycine cleavage system regulatory protein